MFVSARTSAQRPTIPPHRSHVIGVSSAKSATEKTSPRQALHFMTPAVSRRSEAGTAWTIEITACLGTLRITDGLVAETSDSEAKGCNPCLCMRFHAEQPADTSQSLSLAEVKECRSRLWSLPSKPAILKLKAAVTRR